MKSLFITFEGGEGSGKSTQAKLLYHRLLKLGREALLTREPGGTALGTRIRGILKRQLDTPVTPSAELLLFAASRAQIVAEVIRPALENGVTVICDRFADSTTAYQGYGRGIDPGTIATLNSLATGGLTPDLTVFLDIAPDRGLSRKKGIAADRFEQEAVAFHARVRDGYLELAKSEPKRWLVVDGLQSRGVIARLIRERVETMR